MNTLKKLRAKSIRSLIPLILILLAVAVGLFIGFDLHMALKALAPKQLSSLNADTIDGAYVETDIYFNYGYYSWTEERSSNSPVGKTVEREYVIDFPGSGIQEYIGLLIHQNRLSDIKTLDSDLEALFQGEIDESEIPPVHIKGTILPLTGESLEYYEEYMGPSIDLAHLYYINDDRIGDSPVIAFWLAFAGFIFAIALIILFLVRGFDGYYQREIKGKLLAIGDESAMLEKFDSFYDTASEISGVRISNDFVLFNVGSKSILLRPWELVWAYQSTTQHRTNGIPTGKTYATIIRTMDGQLYTLSMSESKVQALLEGMNQLLPGTVLGYSDEIQSLYINQRDVFAKRWEEARPGCTSRA